METMGDKGGNSFEGNIGTNLAKFEILSNGPLNAGSSYGISRPTKFTWRCLKG